VMASGERVQGGILYAKIHGIPGRKIMLYGTKEWRAYKTALDKPLSPTIQKSVWAKRSMSASKLVEKLRS